MDSDMHKTGRQSLPFFSPTFISLPFPALSRCRICSRSCSCCRTSHLATPFNSFSLPSLPTLALLWDIVVFVFSLFRLGLGLPSPALVFTLARRNRRRRRQSTYSP